MIIDRQSKRYIATGFGLLALAVAIGAFGAHALKGKITDHYLAVFETANRYHFIHSLGLAIVIHILHQHASAKELRRIFLLFLVGIILFTGSLYVLSIADLIGQSGLKFMGAITPIGGMLFIAAWLYSAVVFIRER